ncbi:MvdC/MvdD family ATP grasp protein [Streptomyces sp. NPDC002486]
MNGPRPVLVVTSLHDPTADVVIRELYDRGVPVVRLDSGDFPASLSVEAHITEHGLHCRLYTPSRTADLANVRALYYRRPTQFAFPNLDEQDARCVITQARYGLGGVLSTLPSCLYVNHPHRIGDAEFKPAGLVTAADVGFLVPPTLITSSPDVARQFIKAHSSVIYKPLHNPPYRVDGVSSVVKVAEVSAADIDDDVAGTAHLFQERVPKAADVPVTVIGTAAGGWSGKAGRRGCGTAWKISSAAGTPPAHQNWRSSLSALPRRARRSAGSRNEGAIDRPR